MFHARQIITENWWAYEHMIHINENMLTESWKKVKKVQPIRSFFVPTFHCLLRTFFKICRVWIKKIQYGGLIYKMVDKILKMNLFAYNLAHFFNHKSRIRDHICKIQDGVLNFQQWTHFLLFGCMKVSKVTEYDPEKL